MSIFDRFKKNKEVKKSDKGTKDNVLDLVKEDTAGQAKAQKEVKLKDETGDAYKVLVRPQLSEKANMLAASGKYVFRVFKRANKPQIKKAVQGVYDVHVRSVRIVNLQGKARRYGRSSGRTKSWKKAIVTLAPGEKIEGITETV